LRLAPIGAVVVLLVAMIATAMSDASAFSA